MSLDAIRKTILSEAEARAQAIQSDADKQAQRIVKEAEDKARDIVKNAQEDAHKEAERLNKEAQAAAEMEANSMLLEAKGQAVERALKRVLGGAEDELSKSGMKRILDQSVKQFKEVSNGNFTIKTGKKNAELLKKSGNDVEYGAVNGFMLYADNGKVALNATVESIVERQADNARKLISKELFGAGETRAPRKAKAPAPKKNAKAAKKAAKAKKNR